MYSAGGNTTQFVTYSLFTFIHHAFFDVFTYTFYSLVGIFLRPVWETNETLLRMMKRVKNQVRAHGPWAENPTMETQSASNFVITI